jgi:Flp pilus assembly protein TadG
VKHHAKRHQQRGAVIMTVALVLLFLLGFMGIALDFGRLFIVKTEVQTAMDSCALSAAQELDGASDAIDRATAAGLTAGNLNNVYFQKASVGLIDSAVTFSETLAGTYSRAIAPASARYVRCDHTQSGIAPWLLQALTGFSGNASYSQTQGVAALAVATRVPAQTNCIVPVAICKRPPAERTPAKPWGFERGEWVEGVTNDSKEDDPSMLAGQFKWIDLGSNEVGGTRAIKDLLSKTDQCNLPGTETKIEDASGKAGKSNGAVAAWNTRFGLYTGSYSASENTPDLTGHAWYHDGEKSSLAANMPGRYDDTSTRGYQYHRAQNSPYQSNPNHADLNGLKVKEGPKGATTDHSVGSNRRVITIGVVEDCSAAVKLVDFACMLMLHPLPTNANGKQPKMWLEFIGDAAAPSNNPCASIGLPGGSDGLRVPALVR